MCNIKWVCLCIKHQTSGQAAERIITLSRFYIIYWQWQTLSRTKFSFGNSLVSQSVSNLYSNCAHLWERFFIDFCLFFSFSRYFLAFCDFCYLKWKEKIKSKILVNLVWISSTTTTKRKIIKKLNKWFRVFSDAAHDFNNFLQLTFFSFFSLFSFPKFSTTHSTVIIIMKSIWCLKSNNLNTSNITYDDYKEPIHSNKFILWINYFKMLRSIN